MLFPKKTDTSIKGRINDVERAFGADAFLSAISMALTIPDVCGERLYPNTAVWKRYTQWFDTYVAFYYFDDEKGCYFSGTDCYQLRCVYLHEGTNALHVESGRSGYNVVQFRVFESGVNGCDHIGATRGDLAKSEFRQVDLDLSLFIGNMKSGVEQFLAEHPDMNVDSGTNNFLYQPVLDFRERSNES